MSGKRRALELLINNCDVTTALHYIVKAEPASTLQDRQGFHTSVLPRTTLLGLLEAGSPCLEAVVPVAHYLLHRAVLAVRVGGKGEEEGEELIQHTLAALEQHSRCCDSSHHLPITLQAQVVRLWCDISNFASER